MQQEIDARAAPVPGSEAAGGPTLPPLSADVTTRLLQAQAATPVDRQAWRQLATWALEPNPTFEPDWVVPAAIHQTYGKHIDVLLAEDELGVAGAMPLRRIYAWRRFQDRRGRHAGFPYPFITTRVRRFMYSGTPLLRSDCPDAAMRAMLTAARDRCRLTRGRILVLQELPASGPVHDVVVRSLDALGLAWWELERWERPFLHRSPDMNPRDVHRGKDLRDLGRRRRRLEAELGARVEFRDRSNDPTVIEEIIRLESEGYKARTGVAMSVVPGQVEYFRDMCRRFLEQGRFHCYTIEGGDTLCAVVAFIEAGGGLFMIKVGYDERFAHYSPGRMLHLDFIQHFNRQTSSGWIDVCTYADNGLLLRMYPERKAYCTIFVALRGGPIDRAAIVAYRGLRPLHQRIRVLLKRQRIPVTPGA